MQLNYDYFTSPECKILKSRTQTNPRYKNFTQLYYTVGDVEQFWVSVALQQPNDAENENNRKTISDANLLENIFRDTETFVPFNGYKNVSAAQVEDTFNYIFHKFKKGIFIKIKNNHLDAFVPFSKAFYTNEWSDLIQVDPKYKNLENFFKVHHDLTNKLNGTNYRFNVNRINLNPVFWYANNCILRYENPINEGENNYAQLKSMFLELCEQRQLPDIEFFVNRRDFPLLTRNLTEPYNNIYGDNVPLKSYKFDKYMPILSMCSSDRFADIPIPTHEDWARIKSDEGFYFPQKCRNYTFNFNLDWKSKKSIAVFRGSNTGCGTTIATNTRLKLAALGVQHPQLLDVGITNWSLRIRKNRSSKYLQIPNVGNLRLAAKLSPEQQSNYKYLVNVDGHVSAFRLSLELSMGCCILMGESAEKWKMWFSDMLEPYVHYIPIKSDLSDLIEQLQWCLKNDDKCKAISKNALKFYSKYLTKKGVLDNLQKTLFKLSLEMYGGNTRPPRLDPLLFQSGVEHDALTSDMPQTYKLTGLFPKNIGRNYGSLKGLEMFVRHAVKPQHQITMVGSEIQNLFKSKTTKVILYQIGAEYVVAKKTTNKMKKIEFIHEAFIGKYVVNNLLKACPNFVFTLGYRDEPYITDPTLSTKETTVMQEYIKGPTFQEFLRNCPLKNFLEIIFSLSCALIIAQTSYGFVHHDLKPWNIMVIILPEPIILEYYIRIDVTYKLKTRYIPVIIDYGKSHVIHNNVHYGIIDPFTTNTYIDFVTLVLSSANELVLRTDQENLNVEELTDLIFIVNFLSSKKITNIHELKNFLYKTKKFGNLDLNDIDLDLKNSSTIFEEFFKYVTPLKIKYKIGFGKDKSTLNSWNSNARQISDMGFGLELEDKIASYLEVVRRVYRNPIPQATNKFSTLMIAQKMFDGVAIPKVEFVEFATQHKLSPKRVESVLREFEKVEKFIVGFYTSQLNKKIRELFNVGELSGASGAAYDDVLNFDIKPSRRLFLEGDEVQLEVRDAMKNLPAQFPPLLYYRNLVLDVFRNRGPFKIHEDDAKYYLDNFKLLFDDKYVAKVADIETIRFFMNI